MTEPRVQLARPWFDEAEVEAVRRVLQSGWVVQGPEVAAFEDTIAGMHQTRHCIAVSSGTAALHVSYLALGVRPGDAVFIPSFAWPSAANMAVAVRARPVFVDVFGDTYNMDPADLRLRIRQCLKEKWGRPSTVLVVHEFGLAAELGAIGEVAGEFGLQILEDAACALGANYKGTPVGSYGRMGVLSFHPRKAITTGEGGAIVTNDDDLAEKCRMWRNHGQIFEGGSRDFRVAGMNYRMTEIQAAIGRAQLAKFPEVLEKRRVIAERYLSDLATCPGIRLPLPDPEHTWQTFQVTLDDRIERDQLIDRLAEEGVGTGPGSISGHCIGVYRESYGYKDSDLPVSAWLHRSGLALPLHRSMDNSHVVFVVEKLTRLVEEF